MSRTELAATLARMIRAYRGATRHGAPDAGPDAALLAFERAADARGGFPAGTLWILTGLVSRSEANGGVLPPSAPVRPGWGRILDAAYRQL